MKKIFHILLIFSTVQAWSQSISPQVLNSAGGQRVSSNDSLILNDNVGEPFVQTLGVVKSGLANTQGFLQPEAVSNNAFTVTAFVTDVNCSGKNDGRISTALTTTAFNYSLTYLWKPSAVCPANNCTSLDSLKAGTYSLTVIATYTTFTGVVKKDTLGPLGQKTKVLTVQDINGPCRLKVFTGITLNGDGLNDHLIIENISEFPNNSITIFNRWGQQMYHESAYDNTTKFWPTADDVNKLVPSTYFYVLDPGDGSKQLKGWIEIIKN